jgi:DNA-binding SARP family transcriptional activator
MPARRLHLKLLGAFRLQHGDRPVAGFEHARLQYLLAYLALQRAAPISRQQLAFLFWPDSTDQQALENLRTFLTRQSLAQPGVDHFIDITAQTIHWCLDAPFSLDVTEFETAVAQGTAAVAAGDYARAATALAAAAGGYTGALLPDCYEDWILPVRERLHQAYSDVLERLVLLLEEHREYSSALPYARRLLNHDPLSEAAYHHLIRLHLVLGDRTEALRVCGACDAMLEQEFGMAPVPGTHALVRSALPRRARNGQPGALVAVPG